MEPAVFGTADADGVARAYGRFCEDVLGSPVADALFYEVSVTCVAGVVLADGRRVAVRAHQPNRTELFLGEVARAQQHLFDAGFPVPEPVAGPVRFEGRLHTAEAVVDDPGPPDGSDPAVRRAAIDGLERCVDVLRPLATTWRAAHPQQAAGGDLYPAPHSPAFSFDEPLPEVDELARRAMAVRDAATSPPVLAHLDWTVRNIRVVDDRLLVAYDWDSLDLVPQHVLAGQVGITFSSWGDGRGHVPSPGELRAFVSHFEVDPAAAAAAAVWLACYCARCEHSIGRHDGIYLTAVRRWGDAYLSIA